MLHPDKKLRFTDVTDGLSNTIMAVETVPENAVAWSKPADVQIDAADPMSAVSFDRNFQVLMGDGAVLILGSDMDPQDFAGLLTRSGGEAVSP